MTFSDIIETAFAWHGGQISPLYSFASTEHIHSREHKIELLSEIMVCIGGPGLNETTLAEEKVDLGHLCNFVQSAPIAEDLNQCTVYENDGKFMFLYKEMPEPMPTTMEEQIANIPTVGIIRADGQVVGDFFQECFDRVNKKPFKI